MIIKEEDVVITNFGVQGMRLDVRKERYEQNHEKAKNILKTQSRNKEMNVHDDSYMSVLERIKKG